jgi:membrane protease YdiL (CAAX protease family)
MTMAEFEKRDDVAAGSSEAARAASKTPASLAEKIFLNEEGLRAGWRFLVYALLVMGLRFGMGLIAGQFVHLTERTISLPYFYLSETLHFAAIFGAAVVMSRIERRPVGAYGLPLRSAFGKLFWEGCLVGLVEVTALVGLIGLFGGYSFGSLALHGRGIFHWGLLWASFFVVVGLFEEFLFRGYTLYTLADGMGFWPAAILLSLAFGAVHLGNRGEQWPGAAAVVMIGLIFAFTLRRTGNLWFAVGLHASFDFGETFLYSVPNSGLKFEGHLSNAILHGQAWLTGGTAGPEASIFSFLTMGVMALAIHVLFPAGQAQSENSKLHSLSAPAPMQKPDAPL